MFKEMKVKIYADGAQLESMIEEYNKGFVKGFTTNPSLMKKARVKDYKEFSKSVLEKIKDMPISFEVFSDEKDKMIKEAQEIATWGKNVYIKVPVVDTKGSFTGEVIRELANQGIKVNVTAVFTINQVHEILRCLNKDTRTIIPIFVGRSDDTGVDQRRSVK